MSQRMSLFRIQFAPTLALLRFKCSLVPRKQGKEFLMPFPACGGRLGWGRNRAHVTPDFASTLTPTHLPGREELVRAYEVIR